MSAHRLARPRVVRRRPLPSPWSDLVRVSAAGAALGAWLFTVALIGG